jgi:hypothetical protein
MKKSLFVLSLALVLTTSAHASAVWGSVVHVAGPVTGPSSLVLQAILAVLL